MAKYITIIVVDRSGNPLNNAEITVYATGFFSGGALAKGSTNKSGSADFTLDVKDSDKISISARVGSRRSEINEVYPQSTFKITLD